MGSKSQKGSEFERDFCTTLGLWWTRGARDDVFWRSSGSGGRAKRRGRDGRQTAGQHGDVAATDPVGAKLIDLLTIELKRGYTKTSFHDCIDRNDRHAEQEWEGFFSQAIESHDQAGSYAWMIVSRRDRREAFVWVPDHFVRAVRSMGGFREMPRPWVSMCFEVRNKTNGRPAQWVRAFGTTLEEFLLGVNPSHLYAIWLQQATARSAHDPARRTTNHPPTPTPTNYQMS